VVISKALRSLQSRAEMIPVLLGVLVDSMGASGAALVAQTPEYTLTFEAALGVLADLRGQPLDSDYAVILKTIQSGLPYLNLDVAAEPTPLLPGLPFPPKSLAIVPLVAKNETVGALLFSRDADTADNDLPTLQTVAEIAANALQRETLHGQITQQAANLAAINAVSRSLTETLAVQEIYSRLAEAVIQLIPDIGVLLVSQYHPQRERLQPVYALLDGQEVDPERFPSQQVSLATSDPAAADVTDADASLIRPLRTRRPYINNRLQDSALRRILPANPERLTQSAMLIPLLAKGEVLGTLHLQSYTLDRFSQDDAELLAIVGNTAAVSLKNAVLFEETQNRLKRLDALHNIDKAITTNFDLDATLQVVLQQTIERLDVDAAAIYLLDDSGQTLTLRTSSGLRATGSHTPLQLPVAGSLAGEVLQMRRVIHLPDLGVFRQQSAPRLDMPPDEGFQTYFGAPLQVKGQVRGVMELFHRAPLDPDEEWFSFLETLARQTAIAIDNTSLFKKLQQSNLDLTLAYDKTLEGWAKALELRDKETQGHSTRVTDLALYLAAAMGLSGEALVHMRRGALLHDIGKMGIPDNILLRNGPLDADEWEVMRQHPRYAYELLNTIPFLRPALDIPYCHHEKWDGSGYPRGLQGSDIPLTARIFAVIDVWDALLDDRPYRRAWDLTRVNAYIRQQRGTHFDPAVVDAFFALDLAPFVHPSDKIAS
jgi:HD-GYP domain-containing protein (c-di-GMP phosphodiesterase class II)/GTP-sensing pleiotropic transcriptional regulator CodY